MDVFRRTKPSFGFLLLTDELLGTIMSDLQIAMVSQVSKDVHKKLEPIKKKRREMVLSTFDGLKDKLEKCEYKNLGWGDNDEKITIEIITEMTRGTTELVFRVYNRCDYILITRNDAYINCANQRVPYTTRRAQIFPRCKTIRWDGEPEKIMEKDEEEFVVDLILY